ncbi:MAG: T9SS type A sorting domain-containing protein [Candidatus Cloacimonetes bacterium]|nr:T9SS type A sorting domain-containing protein [Candidatus Cloacimonadota bacterium]
MKATRILLIILLHIWICGLLAQNNVDLMLSIQGAHENSMQFVRMAAIDFNADGYDDLIIPQNRSTALSVPAKLYCYWGGTDFDGTPDLVTQGDFWTQAPGSRLLSGDFNGDGYQDIVDAVVINESTTQRGIRYFFGGPNPDLIPDHIIPMASFGTPFSSEFIIQENIGDINNDGCDDIGAFHITPDSLQTWSIAIIFGGTFQSEIVVDNVIMGSVMNISYVGDVNGDEIDDFTVGYVPRNSPNDFSLYLYCGNDGYFDSSDRVLLYDATTEPYNNSPFAFGIGDFNGDGFDDYLSMWVISPGNSGYKIKLGSLTLPQSPELIIDMAPWTTLINVEDSEVSFGDFNGDGYSDMITSEHRSGFWSGAAGLWLGGANPNGVYDLRITPPPITPDYQFGWGTPAIGDFNGDGCDDVAFCAPQSQSGTSNYNGWVHVYAGNTQLRDTTVANEDPLQQSVTLNLRIFPNPAGKDQREWNYLLEGELPLGVNRSRIDVFNIRGQLVASHPIVNYKSKQGTLGQVNLTPGIYIAMYVADNDKIATSKFTIK